MPAAAWLQLIGFGTGALLHGYLTYVIARHGLRGTRRRALFFLVTSLGAWHLGNTLRIFTVLPGLPPTGGLDRIFEAVAYAGLGLLPTALLYAYRVHLRRPPEATGGPSRGQRWVDALLFLPLLFLPLALWLLVSRPESSAILRLREYLYPFIGWLAAALVLSARMSRRMADLASEMPEKRLLIGLGRAFLAIAAGLALVYLFQLREMAGWGRHLELLLMLSSIVPTSMVAYHIYRYNYLELVIRQSILYALLIALLLTCYFLGIRQLSTHLYDAYQMPTVFTESLLISALLAVSFPINGWMNRFVTRRVRTYREFVVSLNEQANTILDLRARVEFIEQAVRRRFDFRGVHVLVYQESIAPGTAPLLDEGLMTASASQLDVNALRELAAHCSRVHAEVLTTRRPSSPALGALQRGLGVNYAFPLRFEKRPVGLLLIDSRPMGDLGDVEDLLLALSGQIAGSIANGRLLDLKLRLEREVARQERLAHLGRMAATMAHEVKNPLSSIKTLVQLMRENAAVQESHGRDLRLINDEIDRLSRTVTQLLSFARPSAASSKAENRLQTVYLEDLARTSATVLMQGEPTERAQVEIDFEPDLPPLTTDGVLLQEILVNLLLNALQARPEGCRVQLRCRRRKAARPEAVDELVLELTDNGPGIPADVQPHIFEAFFTTRQRGTGLGLFIVKRNVEALGGSLSFQSPACETGGTRFFIRLPLVDAGTPTT